MCNIIRINKGPLATTDFQTRIKTFAGWSAQIIRHEFDHCKRYSDLMAVRRNQAKEAL